jgi:hypothetical protein
MATWKTWSECVNLNWESFIAQTVSISFHESSDNFPAADFSTTSG